MSEAIKEGCGHATCALSEGGGCSAAEPNVVEVKDSGDKPSVAAFVRVMFPDFLTDGLYFFGGVGC